MSRHYLNGRAHDYYFDVTLSVAEWQEICDELSQSWTGAAVTKLIRVAKESLEDCDNFEGQD